MTDWFPQAALNAVKAEILTAGFRPLTTQLRVNDMTGAKPTKPTKPYPDYPLTAHGNGQWCKKINGKRYYFGAWSDPTAALSRYLEDRDDIQAGRYEARESCDGVRHVANLYLARQQGRGLNNTHFNDCIRTCKRVVAFFGDASVASLRAARFSALLKSYPDEWSQTTVAAEISRTKALFRWAAEMEIVEHVPNFGPDFKRPTKKAVRTQHAARQEQFGRQDFQADELRRLLDASSGWLRACILLGVNTGFGNTDCARLRIVNVSTHYNCRRQKTGVHRESILWQHTVDAINAAVAERPETSDPENQKLCFLNRAGLPLISDFGSSTVDYLCVAFRGLEKRCGTKRKRRGFYGLRRTFETRAGRDQVAINFAMGHSDGSMGEIYRQGIDTGRLQAVADTVADWLNWTPKAESE